MEGKFKTLKVIYLNFSARSIFSLQYLELART